MNQKNTSLERRKLINLILEFSKNDIGDINNVKCIFQSSGTDK